MKTLRTMVLDELYALLTPCAGKIFQMGEGAEGESVEAEVELVRRNEGFVEMRFLCTAVLDGAVTESHVELVVTAEKQS